MAQNSLFAILLRSRWWISMACGLVIVLLCMAVLPTDIRVVGAMGSLPFFAVGAIAAARQWGQPGSARTQALLAQAGQLSSRELQQWLARAWQAEGYAVTPWQQEGADLELQRAGRATLALTRRGKAGTHGVEPLRALAQAAGKRNAEAVYVLLQGELSDNARDFAREHRLVVLQGQELGALLHKAPANP